MLLTIMLVAGKSSRLPTPMDIARQPVRVTRRKRLELATNATYLKCRQRVLEFLYERHRFVEAA